MSDATWLDEPAVQAAMTPRPLSFAYDRWTQMYAAWEPVPDDVISLTAIERVVGKLRSTLRDAGAVEVGSNVVAKVVDAPLMRARVAIAECRALLLRTPNPFPRIRLFRWLPS